MRLKSLYFLFIKFSGIGCQNYDQVGSDINTYRGSNFETMDERKFTDLSICDSNEDCRSSFCCIKSQCEHASMCLSGLKELGDKCVANYECMTRCCVRDPFISIDQDHYYENGICSPYSECQQQQENRILSEERCLKNDQDCSPSVLEFTKKVFAKNGVQ